MAPAEERIIRLPFLCMLGMDGVYKVLSVINNINEIHPSSQYCRLPKNHLLYVSLVDTIELRLAIVCASLQNYFPYHPLNSTKDPSTTPTDTPLIFPMKVVAFHLYVNYRWLAVYIKASQLPKILNLIS